jgi:hypothetical protein
MRQRHRKIVQLALDPVNHTKRLAKINLSMARQVSKWDKHFPRPPLLLANVIRDDSDAAGKTVLVPKPGMDAFGSVPLLFDNSFVVFQDLIDNRNEWVKLRADRQSSSPIPWGNGMQKDLCHRFAVDPKKTTSCTFAHTINMARPTDTIV